MENKMIPEVCSTARGIHSNSSNYMEYINILQMDV